MLDESFHSDFDGTNISDDHDSYNLLTEIMEGLICRESDVQQAASLLLVFVRYLKSSTGWQPVVPKKMAPSNLAQGVPVEGASLQIVSVALMRPQV